MTRDRIEGQGRIGPLAFTAIDTAGLAEGPEDSIEGRLRQQTERGAGGGRPRADADRCQGRADRARPPFRAAGCGARAGRWSWSPTSARGSRPRASRARPGRSASAPPVPISAQNGEGMADLAAAIEAAAASAAPAGGRRPERSADQPLRLVIAGRPNVGKSSLINRLLAEERLLTGPEPGLTRDAVRGRLAVAGPPHRAGRHRRAAAPRADRARRPRGALEPRGARGAAPGRGGGAAGRCHLAAGQAGPDDRQPRASRPAGRWSWRATSGTWSASPTRALAAIRERLETRLPQIKGVACLPISVLTGKQRGRGCCRRWSRPSSAGRAGCRPRRSTAGSRRRSRPTSRRWPRGAASRSATPPRSPPGRRPSCCSSARRAPCRTAYLRYLGNSLRETFDLPGVPLRLLPRTGDNPYA